MFAFFIMFTASYVILRVILRQLQTRYARTNFGAALAYID